VGDLPPQWREKLAKPADATVTVRIEEEIQAPIPAEEFVTDDPAFGIWRELASSRGLQMGDALIAATALEHQLPVLTGNVKHFAAVEHLLIEGFAI